MNLLESVRSLLRRWFVQPGSVGFKVVQMLSCRTVCRSIPFISWGRVTHGPLLYCVLCGCGDLIQLSLLQKDSPHWRFRGDACGLFSLKPSVWRTAGCCSHFFLRDGLVLWAPRCSAEESSKVGKATKGRDKRPKEKTSLVGSSDP